MRLIVRVRQTVRQLLQSVPNEVLSPIFDLSNQIYVVGVGAQILAVSSPSTVASTVPNRFRIVLISSSYSNRYPLRQ